MKKAQRLLAYMFPLLLATLHGQGHQPVFPELAGQELLGAVRSEFRPPFVQDYNVARDILYGTIDKVNDSLRCIYTDWPVYMTPGADPTTAAFQNGSGLNTEHAWPQTFGADAPPARADMHNLYASRVNVNTDRGNLPFKDIPDNDTDRWYYLNQLLNNPPATNRDAYSEYRQNVGFEPRESVKGNIARSLFYFYTVYTAEAGVDGAAFFNEQRANLCVWHLQDPVDAAEWTRTHRIAEYQSGKANPFVLDCTLAPRLYCPEFIDFMCVTTATDAPEPQQLRAVAYPNPSPLTGQLDVYSATGGTLHIKCYSSLGALVQTQTVQVGAGVNLITVQWPQAGYWHCELLLDDGHRWHRKTLPVVVME
jgi:hypothetical protein